jgi:hypothetical protein
VTVTITVGLVAPPLPTPPGIDPSPPVGPAETGPDVVRPEPLPPLVVIEVAPTPAPPSPGPQPTAPPERVAVAALATAPGSAAVLEVIELAVLDLLPEFEALPAIGKASLDQAISRAMPDMAEAVGSFDVALLWNDLAELKQEFNETVSLDYLVAGSAAGASGVLTVGYVLWTLRGGSLVIGLLAQMPAWRLIDPLVVLDYLEDEERKKGRTDDDDSLESMLERERKEQSTETKDEVIRHSSFVIS